MTGTSMRNAGLRRVSRLTRWVAAGALGATAAFSVMAAKASAGRTASRTPPADQVQTPSVPTAPDDPLATTPTAGDDAGSQDPGLSDPAPLAPPAAAPHRSHRAPVVVSGGS